ncbi:unnamed protein product [Ostreobium quekettii]|uniref:Uncharacterized protein n=1 Tax=Ostreobium quekettii TaxID=121088 RepID=A0A8S1J4Y9_9CHLO|nr:unnamed protein product [Ostreobium quekettii]
MLRMKSRRFQEACSSTCVTISQPSFQKSGTALSEPPGLLPETASKFTVHVCIEVAQNSILGAVLNIRLFNQLCSSGPIFCASKIAPKAEAKVLKHVSSKDSGVLTSIHLTLCSITVQSAQVNGHHCNREKTVEKGKINVLSRNHLDPHDIRLHLAVLQLLNAQG